MEDEDESLRLDRKTDPKTVRSQARWAGIRPGMRVADMGCGSGKTSAVLKELVGPQGEVFALDFSPARHRFALDHYQTPGLHFLCRDVRDSLEDLGTFDFIWVRFLLEYYRSTAFEMVRHFSEYLRPGGILCLIDLDHNALNHYGIPERLEKTLKALAALSEERVDFDPWAGRKLYAHLYDLHYEKIKVQAKVYHLLYGPLKEKDAFNWVKKIEVGPAKLGYDFGEYGGSFEQFKAECLTYIRDPRRFIYTPIILCRGVKSLSV